MQSARSEREIVYDGTMVTLYTPAQKYYSTVEFTGTIGELIDKLEEKYGVEVPLSDLFLFGTPAAPLDKIDSAMNAGQDFIDDGMRSCQLWRHDLSAVRRYLVSAPGITVRRDQSALLMSG